MSARASEPNVAESTKRDVPMGEATTMAGGTGTIDVNDLDRTLARGRTLGRYVLLDRLGAGGMGVVYAGYDPELDRKVAIKLLRGQPQSDDSARRRQQRLLREAQAMARLDHPNVVSVHDVGEFEGGVYVAMEFIDGVNLGTWLEEHEGRWREALEIFIQAGRGLVAAHDKGLIHRDFKPDNVMVGHDGRIRVMDFGLAREAGDVSSIEITARDDVARPVVDALQTPLTQVGALMGTPAFMAPEQYLSREVGPAADQFSFCVALWWGVYGRSPFPGRTMTQIGARVVGGEIEEPPTSPVPRWLRRILERGLSTEAEQRFGSMARLLDALERGLGRQRWRPMIAAGLGVVGLGLVAAVTAHQQRAQQARECQEAGAQIEQVWSAQTREAAEQAIVLTALPYASDAAERVLPRMDAWAQSWSELREATCTAATIDKTLDDTLAKRADECFEERRLRLEALASTLPSADEAAVRGLVATVGRLPAVEPCAEPRYLQLRSPRPEGAEAQVHEIETLLSQAEGVAGSGDQQSGEERAKRAVAQAERLGDAALLARARQVLGHVQMSRGDYAKAEGTLIQAFKDAGRVDDIEVAFTAASDLVYTVGYSQARHAEGLTWANVAEVYVRRLESESGRHSAVLANQVAAIALEQGKFDQAAAGFTNILEFAEQNLGPGHPQIASAMANLAAVANARGESAEAVSLQRRAIARARDAFGEHHPLVIVYQTNLGTMLREDGRLFESKAVLEQALADHLVVHGSDHPKAASAMNNLALAHASMKEYERAESLHRRALEIRRKTLGPEHPLVALSTLNLAIVAGDRGNLDESLALFEEGVALLERALGPEHIDTLRAKERLARTLTECEAYERAESVHQQVLELRKKVLGPRHVEVAESMLSLAEVRRARGALSQAAPLYAQALAVFEGRDAPDRVAMAMSLVGLAQIDLEEQRADEAVPHAERALALWEKSESRPADVAEAQFVLAQALWDAASGQDRQRSASLARRAAGLLREQPQQVEQLDALNAWMAARSLSGAEVNNAP